MFNLPCDEGESMLRESEEDTRVDSRMYPRTAGDSFQISFSKSLVTRMEQGGNRLLGTMKGLHWQGGMFHLPLTQPSCQRKLCIPVQVSLLHENPLLPHCSETDDQRSSVRMVEQLLQDWLQGMTSDSEWLQNCSDGLGSWERKLLDKIFSYSLHRRQAQKGLAQATKLLLLTSVLTTPFTVPADDAPRLTIVCNNLGSAHPGLLLPSWLWTPT